MSSWSPFALGSVASPLPLHWLSVSGGLNSQKQATINWQVEERNVAIYTIEKSTDGVSFARVGEARSKGNGTNTYNYTDASPMCGINYYRLRQVDFDGTATYSNTISVVLDTKNSPIKVYPTLINSSVTIELNSQDAAELTVSDLLGSVLIIKNTTENPATLDLSALAAGSYFLSVRMAHSMETIKIEKQ